MLVANLFDIFGKITEEENVLLTNLQIVSVHLTLRKHAKG